MSAVTFLSLRMTLFIFSLFHRASSVTQSFIVPINAQYIDFKTLKFLN
jgi:hypothetical protein